MSPVITYLAKVGIIYSLCFLMYWILFRRETFFKRNRVFLLMSIVLPPIIPLLQFPVKSSFGGLVSEEGLSWIMISGGSKSEPAISSADSVPIGTTITPGSLDINNIILIIYLLGLAFFLFRMIFNYFSLAKLIISSNRKPLFDMILVITRRMVSPFSIFKWLVIPDSKKDHPDLDKIVNHEMVHFRQKHSYDLLLTELGIIFQWFNPFVWMLKSSVVRNNEYLVDQTLINEFVDQKEYQYALLNNSVGPDKLAMVNGFSKGLIKKRIKMMNKRKTNLVNRAKEIVIIPFALVLILAFSAYTNKAGDAGQDQDRKTIKKEQKTDQRKIVQSDQIIRDTDNTWTVAKKEGRRIVGDDTWTNLEDQDKDQDKKKKKAGKEEISILVDGKVIKIKDYSDEGEEGHIKIIKLSELDNLELGEDIDKNKLLEKLKEYETEGDKTLLLIKESAKDGKKINAYAGAMINTKSDSGDKGVIYIKKDNDGEVSVYTSEKENGYIYISEGDDKKAKFHIRSDGQGKEDYLIVIDGKISDEEALNNLDSDKIYSISILKDEDAVEEYGDKGKNGVIKVTTKK